jgi:hypothetical protein
MERLLGGGCRRGKTGDGRREGTIGVGLEFDAFFGGDEGRRGLLFLFVL